MKKEEIVLYINSLDEKTRLNVLKKFINEEFVLGLPREMRKMPKSRLSLIAYSILLNELKENTNKNTLKNNMPILIKKYTKEKINKVNKKIKTLKPKVIVPSLILVSLATLSTGSVFEKSTKSKAKIEPKTIHLDNIESKEMKVNDEFVSYIMLNNYKKYETIEDIQNRKEELYSLNLTDEDKLYKDCPLDAETQRFIYEEAKTFDISDELVDEIFALIDNESDSTFKTSGMIGKNSDTEDLGLCQLNSKYAVGILFCKKYNVDFNTAYNLVLNDDFVNIHLCFEVLNEYQKNKKFDPYEYAGMYNGYLGWRNYDISREYVKRFTKNFDNKYNLYH